MEEITLGEVSRQVLSLHAAHLQNTLDQNRQLKEIRDEVVRTNGTVGRHEERLNNHWKSIEKIESAQSQLGWTVLSMMFSVVAGIAVWWVTRPR